MSKDTLASFKTGFARTKQQVFQKTGHSDETIDVQYAYDKERIVTTEERMLRIQKNHKKIIDLYKDLANVLSTISTDACDLYDTSDVMYTPAQRLKDLSDKIAANDQAYYDITATTFVQPLNDHLGQYTAIKKRGEELATRKIDMDRYKKEVGQLREKATGSNAKVKLAPTEEKLRICKEGYDALHEELLRDMPLLFEDKYPLFQYLTAGAVKGQEEFYSSTAREWSYFPPMVQSVNDTLGSSHMEVITPVESSSASVNIRDDAVFSESGDTGKPSKSIKEKDRNSTYSPTSSTSSASSTTTPVTLNKTTPPPQPYAPPSGGAKKQAQALYDFNGLDATELSFKAGDRITIHKAEGEWWEGEINGQRGFVPGTYVKLI
ncbi:SH3 domain-containing protein [Tieghemostelium lacteum]|uniref:SH3 domain-containing protein n=1 Tax=Tieghemostelium lacteum TaxID=361077 RepID=A0A151Z6E6_TIELA|nr:SH3 domain-containing protein [Tieghemostelium lacteum]|eukprot:KYQ89508.1 SH3 domain-containing protein [Tieghemostelium lacteum]